MSKRLPWFRAYTEMMDDEKLRLLAFEDRWHFVAILCMKGAGILDESGPLLMRKAAVKMGLAVRELDEVARRLSEVGLIDKDTLQPLAWDTRQMKSDSSAERVQAYRERQKQAKQACNVTVTAQDTDTDAEKEEDKKKAARKRAARTPARPDEVSESVWQDFQAIRKAKRAPLTDTALEGISREAEKAGLRLGDALAYCCEQGWQGFNAGWYADRMGRKQTARSDVAAEPAWRTEQRSRMAEFAPLAAARPPQPSNVIDMETPHAIAR